MKNFFLQKEDLNSLKKVYLLIVVRFIIIILSFIASAIQNIEFASFFSFQSVYFILLLVFILNTLYLFFTRFLLKYLLIFTIFQVIIDLVVETALVYLTGGILSIFVSLYFSTILISGMLISMHASLLCASFSTISLSGIVIVYFLSALEQINLPFLSHSPPPFFPTENDLAFCKAYLFAQAITFYLVAFLSGRLSFVVEKERIIHEEVLENLADGILVVDPQQNIIFINAMAKKLFHLNLSKNYCGKPVTDVLNMESHMDILKALMMQRSLESHTILNYKEKMLPIHIALSTLEIKRKLKACILILTDMSYQKRMKQALEQANRLATIHEMATSIAHEIRNPLASIRGSVQAFQERLSPQDKMYELAHITIKESDRLDRIVTDFLEFSKLRSPVFKRCWLSQLLRETVLLLEQRDTKNTDIIQDIERELFIDGDPGHLKQVFLNLGINAMDSANGKNEITIRAYSTSLGNFCSHFEKNCSIDQIELPGVQILFKDCGTGIHPQHLPKVFDIFFSTKSQGTGMGLAIVTQILAVHKAVYHLETELDKGTSFYIWFPKTIDNQEITPTKADT